jgi:hypothetical protein
VSRKRKIASNGFVSSGFKAKSSVTNNDNADPTTIPSTTITNCPSGNFFSSSSI